MEWNVWVIKPYRQPLTVLRKQKKTFPPSVLQKFRPQGSKLSQFTFCCPCSKHCRIFSMESEIYRVKRARLSQNQIREIVMDSDSDEEQYYTSEDAVPRPPSRRPSISQPASPDFSASSSEDEDDVTNVGGQQPQPGHCQQLHPFIVMWWEENFTQRFSSHPYQRDAGTFWA